MTIRASSNRRFWAALLGGCLIVAAGAPLGSAAASASLPTLAPAGIAAITSQGAGKPIYLTFDDGPNPRITPALLDLLARYHAKATFFAIGYAAAAHPALVRRIKAEGHALGNHTYSHARLPRLSIAAQRRQLVRARNVLGPGAAPCMRPPYGAVSPRTLRVADQLGYSVILWTQDTGDWRRPGSAVIARRVLSRARPGAVVLMHDGGGNRSQTLAAMRTILRRLSARGYSFQAVPACR